MLFWFWFKFGLRLRGNCWNYFVGMRSCWVVVLVEVGLVGRDEELGWLMKAVRFSTVLYRLLLVLLLALFILLLILVFALLLLMLLWVMGYLTNPVL